ncbi:hypothetical protein AtubIFM61612_004628 [Aspergillus tubingensis]|nr:hypothetical protein AtubIFM61612_004628 [Aspergillus tubingensis]
MAVASRAAECAQLFDRLASALDGTEPDIENEIFRFNLWAANNFILAPGRASMDWRLRNAPLLQSTMVELLDDLKVDLIKQPTLPSNSTIPAGLLYEAPLQAISETLDGLFRLSRAIRRSGIHRRYVKVGNYVEFDGNGVNLTEAFKDGAKRLIEFRMKGSKASDGLRERISNTVCLRQQYFSYLKAKKATNAPIAGTYQSHQSTPRPALRASASITGSLTSKAQGAVTQNSSRMRRVGPSTMTATTAQPDRIPKAYSEKSANERTSYDVDCSGADIPPPPKVSGNHKESECPYCFLACSTEELSGRSWKRHFIQDLMPYVCVLESCPTPNSLFESGKDWLSHMKNQHPASGWTCVDSTHNTTFFFQSESGFREHLHQYHEGQFDDDDIDDIAAACYQKSPDDIIIRECPFCPTVQKLELKPKDMIDHVANHLISLAQISLAGHVDGGRSQSAWSGSRRDSNSLPTSLGSLPERLHSEFTDDDENEYLTSISGEVIPDAAEELIYEVWQNVQKPQYDPSPDLTIRHFIAQSELKAKGITEFAVGGSDDLDTSQSFKKGQATAPELNRSSEDSAGVLQTSDSEGSLEIVEMFGEEGNFSLDDQNTDDLPPFLCQSDSEIHHKFDELEWQQRMRLSEGMLANDPAHPYALEQDDPEVKARSRYVNVQAWANCRIHLRVPEGECDFINASPIILKDSARQEERTYIATQASICMPRSTNANNDRRLTRQGPVSGYISHFWQMVFHESKDVAVIVMLTQTFEAGREKCAQYFPPHLEQASMILVEEPIKEPFSEGTAETKKSQETNPANPAAVDQANDEETAPEKVFETTNDMAGSSAAEKTETAEVIETSAPTIVGHPVAEVIANEESPKESNRSFAAQEIDTPVIDPNNQEERPKTIGKITLLEITYDVKSRSEIRKLEVTIGSETKIVWHYLFVGWADYSKPKGDDREALLELIRSSTFKSGPHNPRVVHCSSGVGRTGTFIALDHLLQQLESGQLLQLADPEADPVFDTVNQMREQRMMMVYNEMQFQFIYDVLREQTDIKLGKVGSVLPGREKERAGPRRRRRRKRGLRRSLKRTQEHWERT